MKIINFNDIVGLEIDPRTCVDWVSMSFKQKYSSVLPTKISMKLGGNVFFNTMPCMERHLNRFVVKEVTRFPDRLPAVNADLLLYDIRDGNLLALMDGNWITTMRTGAVAALSITTFRKKDSIVYAFIGLGNTARATLLCLASMTIGMLHIRILAYKEQEVDFIDRFKTYGNINFEVVYSTQELILGADVVVSCITSADSQIALDACYKEGVLVVPVHTLGFQNCDLFFDKIFVDDIGHVEGFKYFKFFKQVEEFSKVLLGERVGRTSDQERIIAYNIGIALHDLFFASKIYDMLSENKDQGFQLFEKKNKFWI